MIHEYKNTCTGSSKHILAPCTLHALDSSIGSDGSSQRTPCQPSKHAQLARSPCRVHVPCSQTGWQVGCSQAATSHPTLSGARAPAVARAVGRGERRLALRAAPAVAVAPESRRRDRRGACEPLAQCSWCHSSRRSTCTGPAPRTRRGPRTRPRTAARSSRDRPIRPRTSTRPAPCSCHELSTSTFFDLNLRTRFRNRQISAVHPPSTKHVAVPPSRTKVLRSILHTL